MCTAVAVLSAVAASSCTQSTEVTCPLALVSPTSTLRMTGSPPSPPLRISTVLNGRVTGWSGSGPGAPRDTTFTLSVPCDEALVRRFSTSRGEADETAVPVWQATFPNGPSCGASYTATLTLPWPVWRRQLIHCVAGGVPPVSLSR